MKKNCRVLYFILLSIFIFSCATIGKPGGGPDDNTAPEVKTAIPKDSTVQFNGSEIIISFNEFFNVKNSSQEVLINPAMKESPEVQIKGKKLVVKLQEKPQENTTYCIDFGNSISDISDGNIKKSFRYAFSTGETLDTFNLKGKVINAKTAKAGSGAWVMLHEEKNGIIDTTPQYKIKTDENGFFAIPFLPKGNFHLYALEDPDGDLKYKAYAEKIAFSDSLVQFSELRPQIKTTLWLFTDINPQNKILRLQKNGKNSALASFRSPVENLIPQFNIDNCLYKFNTSKDTLQIWFPKNNKDSLTLSIGDLKASTFLKEIEKKGKSNDTTISISSTIRDGFIIGEDTLKITSKQPIFIKNSDSIKVYKDSVLQSFIIIDQDPLHLEYKIVFPIVKNQTYRLKIGKLAFENLSGYSNSIYDQRFSKALEEDLGSINLQFNKTFDHPCQILVKGKTIDKQLQLPKGETALQVYDLLPGEYTIFLIEDNDENGGWSTGNFDLRKQPERTYIFPGIIKVRKGFETKTEWRIID